MCNDSTLGRNESPFTPSLQDRLVGSCVLLFATLPGIVLNLLVLSVLLRKKIASWNSTFPYYSIIISKCVSDLIILAIYAGYCVPVIFLQRRLYGEDGERFIGSLRQFAYFSGLFHMVLVAVNRYFGVCQLNRYKTVFSVGKTAVFISTGWMFGALVSALNWLPQCKFRFLYRHNAWGYPLRYKCNVWVIVADVIINVLAFVALVIIYTKVFLQLKMLNRKFAQKTRRTQRRRLTSETRLAIEAITMTAGLLVVWVTFFMIPLFTLDRWFLLALSCLSVVYSSLCACLTYGCRQRLHKLASADHEKPLASELRCNFTSSLMNSKMSTQLPAVLEIEVT